MVPSRICACSVRSFATGAGSKSSHVRGAAGSGSKVRATSRLGSIEDGKYADLLVLDSVKTDPYENLVAATEKNIRLVVIAGHVRYGDEALVRAAGLPPVQTEKFKVGSRKKLLNLHHPASPINHISLAGAAGVLRDEMSDLERAAGVFTPLSAGPVDTIELDIVPHEEAFDALAAVEPVKSLVLDALTVIDDINYFDALDAIPHLPAFPKGANGLRKFYQAVPP